jgi:hypothetical protein
MPNFRHEKWYAEGQQYMLIICTLSILNCKNGMHVFFNQITGRKGGGFEGILKLKNRKSK